MNNQHLTVPEIALLDKADAFLELCSSPNLLLSKVPAFVVELDLLREKRALVKVESVKKSEAKSSKETVVADASTEKKALAMYIDDALGMFKVCAKKQNNALLAKIIPSMVYSKLILQKTVLLVASVDSFVSIAEKVEVATLENYGIEKTWLPELKTKTQAYQLLSTSKATLKSNKPKATAQFKTVIEEIKEHLSVLKDLLGGYKINAPDFYVAATRILLPAKKFTKKITKKTPDSLPTDKIPNAPEKKGKKKGKTTQPNTESITETSVAADSLNP